MDLRLSQTGHVCLHVYLERRFYGRGFNGGNRSEGLRPGLTFRTPGLLRAFPRSSGIISSKGVFPKTIFSRNASFKKGMHPSRTDLSSKERLSKSPKERVLSRDIQGTHPRNHLMKRLLELFRIPHRKPHGILHPSETSIHHTPIHRHPPDPPNSKKSMLRTENAATTG